MVILTIYIIQDKKLSNRSITKANNIVLQFQFQQEHKSNKQIIN